MYSEKKESEPLISNDNVSDEPIHNTSIKNPTFKFIDLFAGIGGFHIAMHENGGQCVFASELDKFARITYEENFKDISPEIFENGLFNKDITDPNLDYKDIPDFDVLCAGFPCQAFSIAGYRQGFNDEKGRGNLFFNILDILYAKKPKAFILENVKNLESHDKGNTFKRILFELDKAGYKVKSKVLNSKEYSNTPQTRERIFIVGFKSKTNFDNFSWPEKIPLTKTIHNLIDDRAEPYFYYNRFKNYDLLKSEITKRDTVYQWRRVYVRENKSNVCPTLTANMGTGGHNVPLILDDIDIRKLTPRECARFQGFPEDYILPEKLAKSHLYKQIGNSVTVPLVSRVTEQLINGLNSL